MRTTNSQLYYNIVKEGREENTVLEEIIHVMQKDFSNLIRDNEKTIALQKKRIDNLLEKNTTLTKQLKKLVLNTEYFYSETNIDNPYTPYIPGDSIDSFQEFES